MNVRGLAILVAALAAFAVPSSGIDTSRPVTEKIGILDTPPPRAAGVDKTVRKVLPGYLREALAEAGFTVTLVGRTIDAMKEGTDDDILIDVGFADESGSPLGAVGAGAVVEGVGVGGEVSVVEASAMVEIRIYNAKTLEPLTSLEMNGEATGVALTSIGIGDPYGWFQIRIPIKSKGPLKQVARNIARDAAAALREEFGR
jgi:hypothetical protein